VKGRPSRENIMKQPASKLCFSENSVDIQIISWRYNPGNETLHSHRYETPIFYECLHVSTTRRAHLSSNAVDKYSDFLTNYMKNTVDD
jgi:hypothetical protein